MTPVTFARQAVPQGAPTLSRQVFHFEGQALGSPLRLQVHGGTAAAAAAGWAAVEAEFSAVDGALSRHRDDSELTALNRVAGSDIDRVLSPRLYAAIAATDRARRLTDGRFDARVLASLERLGDHGAALDDHRAPRDAQTGTVPMLNLRRDPRARTTALDRPHDLGGIGKGLALRWAAARVGACLASSVGFLLEAGGDVIVDGRPADGPDWSIAIEDPRLDGSLVAVIAVDAGAVCTSSVARRTWRTDAGRPVHHLIDPRTGEPGGEGLQAVTVAGADPAWAEVWSKALFLEGRRGIAGLARARGSAAWWVDADGELSMTPAARMRTRWTRDLDTVY